MTTPTTIKPPFNEETARAKVKAAQDVWDTRDPERVAQAYTLDSIDQRFLVPALPNPL